jgi:hypothetical protein
MHILAAVRSSRLKGAQKYNNFSLIMAGLLPLQLMHTPLHHTAAGHTSYFHESPVSAPIQASSTVPQSGEFPAEQ